jgi:hypothetical protein
MELGDIVRHRRTGFTGMVTSSIEKEGGGTRLGVSIVRLSPRVIDGSRCLVLLPSEKDEELFFDEEQLDAVEWKNPA